MRSTSILVSHEHARAIELGTATTFASHHYQAVAAGSNAPWYQWSQVQHLRFRAVQEHLTCSDLDSEVVPGQVNVHVHQGNMTAPVLYSDDHHEMVTGYQDIRIAKDRCPDTVPVMRAINIHVTRPLCIKRGCQDTE
jgi:hypothetical protein